MYILSMVSKEKCIFKRTIAGLGIHEIYMGDFKYENGNSFLKQERQNQQSSAEG